MLLSIADGRPRNLESVRTQSLFPENIQSGAANIIAFIQEYYDYINTHGLPSSEIGSIITDKDIDAASNDYLDNIRDLIAKNIPNSTSLDKVTLYKIIVKYYNTRGSEDSIIAFFKIFLNETVSIFYPKEYLFTPSSGTGFASDEYKIQDSNYWQNYSYVIQSNSDPTTWRDSFLKFVHPAGLKLFTSLLLEMQSLNVWDSYISYQLTNQQDRYSWLSALNPPYFNDPAITYHQHSPKYQPGWLNIGIIEYIFTALFAEGSISLSREVVMVFQFIMSNAASERQLISQDYDLNGIKFRDPSRLGDGFLGDDRTIQSMTNSGLESYVYKMLNVASVVRQGAGPNKVTTGGTGTGCVLSITTVNGGGAITSLASVPTIAGTGYTVGDVLTLIGGTAGSLATATVATISGGDATGPVATVTILTAGLGYIIVSGISVTQTDLIANYSLI